MWEEGPGVLGEMRRRGELATFALSSSSEREEEEDEDDEEEKRRQRQHQFLYEEEVEEEEVEEEEEEVKLRDETNAKITASSKRKENCLLTKKNKRVRTSSLLYRTLRSSNTTIASLTRMVVTMEDVVVMTMISTT